MGKSSLLGAIKPYGNSKTCSHLSLSSILPVEVLVLEHSGRDPWPWCLSHQIQQDYALLGYQQFADIRMEFNSEIRFVH
jgi:hypothetical protein